MSRTYKDRPDKLRMESWKKDRQEVEYLIIRLDLFSNKYMYFTAKAYMQIPTTKTKKRKEVDTEDHWMTTPSWWTRLRMNRPQRREGTLWERGVIKSQLTDLEEVDKPSVSRKPHQYYW